MCHLAQSSYNRSVEAGRGSLKAQNYTKLERTNSFTKTPAWVRSLNGGLRETAPIQTTIKEGD